MMFAWEYLYGPMVQCWGIVLLPTAWLTQMSPEMIEAILAHEFSHLRRHDAWVNLLQRLVESTFFYHPAVWWLSRTIRVEREYRSDADAIRVTGKRCEFAKALELAARQGTGVRWGLVSNLGVEKMSLLNRVNRVLDNRNVSSFGNRWQVGLLALLVPGLLFLSSAKQESRAEEKTIAVEQPLAPVRYAVEVPDRGVSPLSNESDMKQLPDYLVEPPDVLRIEAIRLVPKKTYELAPSDVLHVTVKTASPDVRRIDSDYTVTLPGTIELGSPYGSVTVKGLSVIEAESEIEQRWATTGNMVTASVSLLRIGDEHVLSGKCPLGPDGTIELGRFGRVRVSGKTIVQARHDIEKRLSNYFDSPRITLDLLACHSKFFYVVLDDSETNSSQVFRFALTGNETVLDAIAQIGGLDGAKAKAIWIGRPSPDGVAQDLVLPVSWDGITSGVSTDTNYQLAPGDRLFISENDGDAMRQMNQDNEVVETDTERTVRRFNKLVKAQKYKEAIDCARQWVVTESNRPIAEALRHHANLIAQDIAYRSSEAGEVADVISELRDSRLAEITLRRALREKKMVVHFDETPLAKALETIAGQMDVNVVIDRKSLVEQGVLVTTPVSLDLRQPVSGKNLMQLLLEPLHLTYDIQHGVIRVTSEQANLPPFAQAYDVSDLIGLPMRVDKTSEVTTLDYDQLISLITTTVAPTRWAQVGGCGSIVPFVPNKSLVISNSKDVHDEVRELFEQLRLLVRQ